MKEPKLVEVTSSQTELEMSAILSRHRALFETNKRRDAIRKAINSVLSKKLKLTIMETPEGFTLKEGNCETFREPEEVLEFILSALYG